MKGLASYPETIVGVDKILAAMKKYSLDFYRLCFSFDAPVGSQHEIKPSLIQHFLDNSNYVLVIDANHRYPPGTFTDSQFTSAENRCLALARIFKAYQTRIIFEFVNEAANKNLPWWVNHFHTRLHNEGLMFEVVQNRGSKGEQTWAEMKTAGNIICGHHFYFNSWSVEAANLDMDRARAAGFDEIINTEVGASWTETPDPATVAELTSFLKTCESKGIDNALWLNHVTDNLPKYEALNFYWFEAPPEPLPPPRPCLIANLAIATGTTFLLPYIRLFRDSYVPQLLQKTYYDLSRLLLGVKPRTA